MLYKPNQQLKFLLAIYEPLLDYILIPTAVLLDARLTNTAKLIFGLAMVAKLPKDNKTLSILLDVSQPTVSAAFSQLTELGLLETAKIRNVRTIISGSKIGLETRQFRVKEIFTRGGASPYNISSFNKLKEQSSPKTVSADSLRRIHPYIKFWNSLPNTRKHAQPSSKVYKEILRKFRMMRKGIYFTKVHLDKDWLAKNKITKKQLAKKWGERSIKQAMQELDKLLTEGYWPKDKSKLPKSLNSLLYNPRTQKSLFLYVYMNGAHLLDPPKRARLTHLQPYCTRVSTMLRELCGMEEHSIIGSTDVEYLLKALLEEYKEHPLLTDNFDTFDGFIQNYSNWFYRKIGHEKSVRKCINFMKPTTKVFKEYLEGLEG